MFFYYCSIFLHHQRSPGSVWACTPGVCYSCCSPPYCWTWCRNTDLPVRGKWVHKRRVGPGASDANIEREMKLTLFSSSAMFARRFLKRVGHPWHRSTFVARTGPAEDARQVTISIIISSSRELDTSARWEKVNYRREPELHLTKWFRTGGFSHEGTIAMVVASGNLNSHARRAGFIYTVGLFGLGIPSAGPQGSQQKENWNVICNFLVGWKNKMGSVRLREPATAEGRKTSNSAKY